MLDKLKDKFKKKSIKEIKLDFNNIDHKNFY